MQKTERASKEEVTRSVITFDIIILLALIKYYNSPSANNSWTAVRAVPDLLRSIKASKRPICHQSQNNNTKSCMTKETNDKKNNNKKYSNNKKPKNTEKKHFKR